MNDTGKLLWQEISMMLGLPVNMPKRGETSSVWRRGRIEVVMDLRPQRPTLLVSTKWPMEPNLVSLLQDKVIEADTGRISGCTYTQTLCKGNPVRRLHIDADMTVAFLTWLRQTLQHNHERLGPFTDAMYESVPDLPSQE